MATDNQMWDWTLNMTLATYYSRKPDRQVRTMAKRYSLIASDPGHKRTLRTIRKAAEPAKLVRLVYEELTF